MNKQTHLAQSWGRATPISGAAISAVLASCPPTKTEPQNQNLYNGKSRFRKCGLTTLLLVSTCLGGCAPKFIPPKINYDNAVKATLLPPAPEPVQIVQIPEPLPLPGQLKPLPDSTGSDDTAGAANASSAAQNQSPNPLVRVERADEAARIQPVRDGFINAVQVYPYSAGALYQVYTAPSEITDIALQPGEKLAGSGPIAAGDTVRWIIGNTDSGAGTTERVHILIKPTLPDLQTNLVINTDRRTYLVELHSTPSTYMASVSWQYPQDQLFALKQQNTEAGAAAPIATDINIASLNFRYAIEGDNPPWQPLRAFDDGSKVYIEFPTGISQGTMPPLFVVGPTGNSELVNYRVQGNYYIVDQLFAAAELRLGGKSGQQIVRIVRTDSVPAS